MRALFYLAPFWWHHVATLDDVQTRVEGKKTETVSVSLSPRKTGTDRKTADVTRHDRDAFATILVESS